jgi:hypothetical protein
MSKRTHALGRSLEAQQKEYADTLTIACPYCKTEAGEWCITRGGKLVSFSPHKARLEAAKKKVKEPEPEPEKHAVSPPGACDCDSPSCYTDLWCDRCAQYVDYADVNKLRKEAKRSRAVVKRMLPKLREHYTDEYIIWELLLKGDE